MTDRADPAAPLGADVAATIALALFSATVAAGFARVFGDWAFFDNMLALVVVGHGSGLLLRRARVPGLLAAPLMLILLVWMIGAIHYRFTYSFLMPTGETWALFEIEIGLVRDQFRTAVAPVLYGGGWDVLAAIGLAAAVLLSDLFAFRAYARAEALVPGGVLFVFVAALGTDRQRVQLAAMLVAAGVLATVVLRAYHAPRPPVISRGRSAMSLALPAAVATALAVALVAGVVGPRLPGARAEPVYETRGRGGGRVTEIVSPLVDIRTRLTNRSNAELFVVQANGEAYWRSSALPRFDGSTWGLPERALSTAGGGLSVAPAGTEELRQRVRIVKLGGSLLPAAAEPTNVSPSENLRWSADTSTLVKTDGEFETGDTYDIVSAAPRFDAATLAAATSSDPGDPIYLELPADWPASITQIARDVTAGAETPYAAALALQGWFRDPNEWSYSLEVQAGHGTRAIEVFLRERVGYCEQFAGTYAAMMRSLGIPSRVSVGFTTGNDIGGGTYSVLGKNAHAWPEVWFDGLGWVPFEPTPGRGAPGAEDYTSVAPQQDDSGVDPDAPREQADPNAPPTTLPGIDPADNPLNADELPVAPGSPTGPGPETDTPAGGTRSWPLAVVFLVLAAAIAAPAAVRRWRRSRATDPPRRLAGLWQRAVEALTDVGLEPDDAMTPLETAAATAGCFPVAARPITSLAEAMTAATYSPTGTDGFEETGSYGTSTMRMCAHACRQIERATRDSLGLLARARRYFTRWH